MMVWFLLIEFQIEGDVTEVMRDFKMPHADDAGNKDKPKIISTEVGLPIGLLRRVQIVTVLPKDRRAYLVRFIFGF